MKVLRISCVFGGFLFLVLSLSAQTFNSLYSFNFTDGAYPVAPLIQATNGTFYGTTEGGANPSCGVGMWYDIGCGTVFKITPGGNLTTLYSFCSQNNCTDGQNPYAGLIRATDGNFYGTTEGGGANGDGTVFKITPGGKLTTLHSFDSTDGANPYAGLVQASNGKLYGTTEGGGTSSDGAVFKITPGGKLTALHSFDGTDGANPYAGLVQATDGNFYGTTSNGGRYTLNPLTTCEECGTVFKITPKGKLTTLYSFNSDGAYPVAPLIQAANGSFYGTTQYGGSGDNCVYYLNDTCGTVFSLSVGLGPLVETNPTSGKVGAAVNILGTDLTGATNVTFNGTAAVFEVASASLIKTTVPEGATTGTVEVTTPKGTLKSNVVFRVTK